MIPQYESTGEWVQRIEEQKRSEPSKKTKKQPTGILKDLMELKRYELGENDDDEYGFSACIIAYKKGSLVEWSDVEAIINKYSHP